MPEEEENLLRRSIIASAKKPHPSKLEGMDELMEAHASRMDIVRLHQRAEDAEQEAAQARMIAAMEAEATDKVRAQLGAALAELARMENEKGEFLLALEADMRETSKLTELQQALSLIREHHATCSENEALLREKAETEKKVKTLFDERTARTNEVRHLQLQLKQARQDTLLEHERLVALGQQSEREAQRRAREMRAQCEYETADLREDHALKTEEHRVATERLATAEQEIIDLKQMLAQANKQVEEERANVEAKQAEIDGIHKTIWLRKYDAASPRRPGRHEKEFDPHAEFAGTGGLYAGQVGFSSLDH